MRMLIGTAANFVSGYYIGRNSGLLGTLLGWAFLLGGGYLLIENWDSITVWMHSLNIVQGLDGYEDMSNGFILILLSPIFVILLVVCFVLMNIVACTLVLLTSPSTYIKKKDKENEWERVQF
ncbi:TPA: hypothetical protein QCQ09_005634 [Bacillus cereus]|nr:hypothetical protein [Bacillus cereus]